MSDLSRFTFHVSRYALLCAILVGCAIPQVPSHPIYEDPVNFVRLEKDARVLAEWPPSRHRHPAQVSAQDMAKVLRGFSVKVHRITLQRWFLGESVWEPVFREEEIQLLAPALAEGMRKAAPDERLTFYLSQPITSMKREITSGGLFVREDGVHFILGNHRFMYGIPAYGMVYDKRYPMAPTAPKGLDLAFHPSDAMVKPVRPIIDDIFGMVDDEVILDLAKIQAPETISRDQGATMFALAVSPDE